MSASAVCVIQARASSTRLPRKVLREMAGAPMLRVLLQRLEPAVEVDGERIATVLATSTRDADDPVAELGEAAGFPVVRGSESDVVGRFVEVCRAFQPEAVVRLTGDNPMMNADAIRRAWRVWGDVYGGEFAEGVAVVSNTVPEHRRAPYGFALELIDAEQLMGMDDLELSDEEREHVSLGFARRDLVRAFHLLEEDCSELRWTVDYPEDFGYMSELFEDLGRGVSVERAVDWSRNHAHPFSQQDGFPERIVVEEPET